MSRNRLLWSMAVVSLLASVAVAQKPDRVQIGRDIVVEPTDKVGDVVCILCSIHIRGQAAGDVVAVAGRIVLETGAQVAGDVVAVGGGIRLESGTQVAGGVTAVGGGVRRDPLATIAGDLTALSGGGWMLLLVFVPLLVCAGFITLIVWIIQRSRKPTPAYPAATSGARG
jgi:hypothetical protein